MTSHHPGNAEFADTELKDRLAIHNLLGAYAHYANMARFEDWCGLFAEDATFTISAPGAPGQPLPVQTVFDYDRADFEARAVILENPDRDERKWYFLVNPFIISLTADKAEITLDLVNMRTLPTGPDPRVQNCARYMGELIKQDGCWKIKQWEVVAARVPQPLSNLPATWWVGADRNV